MHDDTPSSPATAAEPPGRRGALGLLALLLAAPLLASCSGEVRPGSGAETIQRSRQQNPPSGR